MDGYLFINRFNYNYMITLKEKKAFLNDLISSEDVCTCLSKNDKLILKSIKKDILAYNKPLKLPKDGLLQQIRK
jgi:hypothetical protein